jgi:hypothetical protein
MKREKVLHTDTGYDLDRQGYLTTESERFKILGNIHTHQDPYADAAPSFSSQRGGYGDVGLSYFLRGLPVMTMGHDGKVYTIASQKKGDYIEIKMDMTINDLLGGQKLVPWLQTYPSLQYFKTQKK